MGGNGVLIVLFGFGENECMAFGNEVMKSVCEFEFCLGPIWIDLFLSCAKQLVQIDRHLCYFIFYH